MRPLTPEQTAALAKAPEEAMGLPHHTPVDPPDARAAYARAVALWGATAGVWSPGPQRHFVGRWVPLGRYEYPLVLRTSSCGLEVLGEGPSWSAAFAAAEKAAELGAQP